MIESIIDGLFYGGISNVNRSVVPDTERVQLNQKIEAERRYFISKMSVDDCQRFEALNDLCYQTDMYDERDSFSYGLRLGVILMCEVFLGEGSPIVQK